MVTTVPLVMKEFDLQNVFSIYPNLSIGSFCITSLQETKHFVNVKVYDLLGLNIYKHELSFSNNKAFININAANGIYILELSDAEGNISRKRIEIRN